MTEPPRDDDRDDDRQDPGASGDESNPRSNLNWSEVFAPVNERVRELIAPIAASAAAQIRHAVEPVAKQVQAQIRNTLPPLPSFKIPPEVIANLRLIVESRPPNWPDDMDYDERLPEAIQGDGIPLVWVPRARIVLEVLAASDRPTRIKVLADQRAEVIEDCRAVLMTVSDRTYAGKVQLAVQAVDALAAGHDEAAQALATVVVESATRLAIDEASKKVQNRVRTDLDDVVYVEMRLRAALAPLDVFYTDWHPVNSTHPMPDALSRHVTCHSAEPAHFTEGNAVVAVMLAASVLRGLQELDELRAAKGDPTWLRK